MALFTFGHFLWIFFGLLVATGGIVLVYIKKPPKHWVWMHKLIAFTGFALTFVGVASLAATNLASGAHVWLGIAASVVALIAAFCSVLFTFTKQKGLRTTHIWLGRLTVGLWLVALIFGLIAYL